MVYRAWPIKGAPELPYICYIVAYSNNFSADGVVYQPIDHVQIELYTKDKNPEAEDRVESALSTLFGKNRKPISIRRNVIKFCMKLRCNNGDK